MHTEPNCLYDGYFTSQCMCPKKYKQSSCYYLCCTRIRTNSIPATSCCLDGIRFKIGSLSTEVPITKSSSIFHGGTLAIPTLQAFLCWCTWYIIRSLSWITTTWRYCCFKWSHTNWSRTWILKKSVKMKMKKGHLIRQHNWRHNRVLWVILWYLSIQQPSMIECCGIQALRLRHRWHRYQQKRKEKGRKIIG